MLAQGMGSLTISLGTMKANESRQLGAVVEAIRFLWEGHRQKRATISRANLLLAAWDDTSIISQIFRKAGLSETEFLSLLKAVVEGGAFERERIKGIDAAVAPSLPSARGRKVSAASAVHEVFLETVGLVASPRAYTWSNVVEDFVDEETKATRVAGQRVRMRRTSRRRWERTSTPEGVLPGRRTTATGRLVSVS